MRKSAVVEKVRWARNRAPAASPAARPSSTAVAAGSRVAVRREQPARVAAGSVQPGQWAARRLAQPQRRHRNAVAVRNAQQSVRNAAPAGRGRGPDVPANMGGGRSLMGRGATRNRCGCRKWRCARRAASSRLRGPAGLKKEDVKLGLEGAQLVLRASASRAVKRASRVAASTTASAARAASTAASRSLKVSTRSCPGELQGWRTRRDLRSPSQAGRQKPANRDSLGKRERCEGWKERSMKQFLAVYAPALPMPCHGPAFPRARPWESVECLPVPSA